MNLLSDSSHAEDANDVAQDYKIRDFERKESTQEKERRKGKKKRRDGEVSDVKRLKSIGAPTNDNERVMILKRSSEPYEHVCKVVDFP